MWYREQDTYEKLRLVSNTAKRNYFSWNSSLFV